MTRELLARLLADVAARRTVVLATRLRTGGAELIHPCEAGEPGDPALRAEARAAAAADAARTVQGGEGPIFLRAYNPSVRVVVVGAVHVAQALGPMVQRCGYQVLVVDPRRGFATAARFPGLRLRCAWPNEALAELGPDRRTAVVTLAHDAKIDDPALAAALRSQAFYVGALGSRRTAAARRERLAAQGFDAAALARIHGPVGLALGATTPGEIAVAILAQLVSRLRQPTGGGPA